MDHCAQRRCGIIPPHILEHITTCASAEITGRQRALAGSTLRAMDAVHRARVALGATNLGLPPGHSITDHRPSSGHQSIIPSYIYDEIAKADEIPKKTREQARLNVQRLDLLSKSQDLLPVTGSKVPRHFYRVIRDAHQKNESTGSVIAHEGIGASSIANGFDAQKIWDTLEQIFDFYDKQFGRNSVDDKGLHLIATVHFDDDNGRTPGFMNAFWDPRTNEWYFGDGDGVIFDDFAKSIDIVAHEYAHAVTQYSANLPYSYQAGALNEHFSDVFGALVKQKFHKDGQQKAKDADWLVGAGVFLNKKAPALRDMKNPGTAYDWDVIGGKDPQPADMGGYKEISEDNGGVHIFSGIPNRAFYLVATGFKEPDYSGFAWEEAGKIWYQTLIDPVFKNYFDPDTQRAWQMDKNVKNAFKLFADLTSKHAAALYGQKGREIVAGAWKTVKVIA